MQPARLGACDEGHGWIPFPALRAAGNDTNGVQGVTALGRRARNTDANLSTNHPHQMNLHRA
jgi:hypothetical protein